MDITGKIIIALPEQTGTSKAGNAWKKKEYVLETQENFPRKVHFDFFGERADQYPLNVGDVIKLSFDIESREYNGRWYTSIRGWKAERADAPAVAGAAPAPSVAPTGGADPFSGAMEPPMPAASYPASPSDDLPF